MQLRVPFGLFDCWRVMGLDRSNQYLSLIREPNTEDRLDRWENLSSLIITPQFLVEPYHCSPLEKLNVCGRLVLWIAFTPNPLFGHQVAIFQIVLSHYAPTLNESTNDRYQILKGEPNPKGKAQPKRSI